MITEAGNHNRGHVFTQGYAEREAIETVNRHSGINLLSTF